MTTMRELVSHSVGGGWGDDQPADGSEKVAIIRGADFPHVTVGDVSSVPLRWESSRKIPQRALQVGDIILEGSGGTSDRPTGRTVYVSQRLLDQLDVPVIPASFCRLVRIDPVKADPHFVYWWLQGMYADGRTWAYQNRSTGIANFQFQHFLDAEKVELPSIEEQRAIAATLGALNDKIESNRRAIATISDLLDAISESNGADLPNVPLGDIATSIKDSVNPLKLDDAPVDHFSLPAFDSGARPERVSAASIKSNKLRVPKSAILISRLNPRFNRTWWASAEAETSALASTEFLVLTSEDALELAAVWLAVRDPFFREELPKRVTGTSGSHQRVRPDDLLTINVPDFRGAAPEVKQTTLGLLMRSESLRIESDRLTSLRDALLPELLSGHIRVPVSEVAV